MTFKRFDPFYEKLMTIYKHDISKKDIFIFNCALRDERVSTGFHNKFSFGMVGSGCHLNLRATRKHSKNKFSFGMAGGG